MKSPHDAYIAKAPEFAQPILEKIRKAFRKACPDVVESLKWSSPAFEHHGILGGMAAFKKHVSLSFWRATEMEDPEGILDRAGNALMGMARFEKASDVPSQAVLVRYVKEAMRINEELAADRKTKKPTARKKKAPAKPAPKVPADLLAALKTSKKALAAFESFPPSHKREYVEWITEAKRDATREKRIAQAVEWMTEGKPRNWRYMPQWR